MPVRIQFRRGTQEEWTTENPVLMEGELGAEIDTGRWKIGDGVNQWNALGYGTESLESAITQLDQEISALEDSRIVEYGENENGHYWRWESGLQICRGVLTVSFQDGGRFAQSYPATSLTTCAVTVSFGDGVNSAYRQAIADVGVAEGSNYFAVYLHSTSQAANNTARWSAIGRWK